MTYSNRRSPRSTAPKSAFAFEDVKPGVTLTEGPNVFEPTTIVVEYTRHDAKNGKWVARGHRPGQAGCAVEMTYWVAGRVGADRYSSNPQSGYSMPLVILVKQ